MTLQYNDLPEYYLCLGVFFFVFSDKRKRCKKKIFGEIDAHSEKQILKDICEIFYADNIEESKKFDKYNILNKDISSFKTCINNQFGSIPLFFKEAVPDLCDETRSQHLSGISDLIKKHIENEQNENDPNKTIIRFFLTILENDKEISDETEFYCKKDGLAISKKYLLKEQEFEITSFLYGILRFLINERRLSNKKGKKCIDKLSGRYPDVTDHNRRKLDNSIIGRDKYIGINVKFTDYPQVDLKHQSIVYRSNLDFDTEEKDNVKKDADSVVEKSMNNNSEPIESQKTSEFPASDSNASQPDTHKMTANEAWEKYINKETVSRSKVKTLLYKDEPHDLYDFYVCSDLSYKKPDGVSIRDLIPGLIPVYDSELYVPIKNVTINKIKEINEDVNWWLISGTCGAGKTLMMTHLFLSSAAEFRETRIIPIFLELRHYGESSKNLITFIVSSLKEFLPDINLDDLKDKLNCGEVLLLLDGLDEIRPDLIDSFIKEINSFSQTFDKNTVIISSRPVDNESLSLKKFVVLQMDPFTDQQSAELISKLCKTEEKAKRIREDWGILTSKDITENKDGVHKIRWDKTRLLLRENEMVAQNPLCLSLMYQIYSMSGETPDTCHRFYDEIFLFMCNKQDKTKDGFTRKLLTQTTAKKYWHFFEEFCFKSFLKEKQQFDIRTISDILTGIIPDIDCEDVLNNLIGLGFIKNENGYYCFAYKSLQPFFAAGYLSHLEFSELEEYWDKIAKHKKVTDVEKWLCCIDKQKYGNGILMPMLSCIFSDCDDKKSYMRFLDQMIPWICFEKNVNLYNGGNGYILSIATSLRFRYIKELITGKKFDEYFSGEAYIIPPQSNIFEDQLRIYHEKHCRRKFDGSIIDDNPMSTVVSVSKILNRPDEYSAILSFMQAENFPSHIDYIKFLISYEKFKINEFSEPNDDSLWNL